MKRKHPPDLEFNLTRTKCTADRTVAISCQRSDCISTSFCSFTFFVFSDLPSTILVLPFLPAFCRHLPLHLFSREGNYPPDCYKIHVCLHAPLKTIKSEQKCHYPINQACQFIVQLWPSPRGKLINDSYCLCSVGRDDLFQSSFPINLLHPFFLTYSCVMPLYSSWNSNIAEKKSDEERKPELSDNQTERCYY